MKFKTAREAYKDAKLISGQDEEEFGCDYNYIVANHFSLNKYLTQNNISFKDAFDMNVLCRVTIFPDPITKHLRKEIKEKSSLQKAQIFEDKLYMGGRVKDLIFKNGDRRMVPLLYLITDGFSISKELIYQTRMYEEDDQKTSSGSIQRVRQSKSLLADSLYDVIEASMFCKANVFFTPIAMSNGDPVEWYIPNSDEDENRNNALRLYEESGGCHFEEEYVDSESDQIISDDKMSDSEIIKALKEGKFDDQQSIESEISDEEMIKALKKGSKKSI